MSERIQLYKIYDAIINKTKLTKDILLSFGLTEENITTLIKSKKIIQKETGEYTLASINDFFNYHVFLLHNGFVKEAILCLEACYEMEPNNEKVAFALMKMYIKTKKHQKAFDIFEKIDNQADEQLKKDTNLYLYLLSIVCNYPEKYKERVLKLTYSDLKIADSSKYKEINNQNRLRTHLINGQYMLAIYLYRNKLVNLFPEPQERLFIEELLKQIKEIEEKKIFSLQTLAETQKYSDMAKYIEMKRTKNKINYFEALVYYISKKIVTISETKEVPTVKPITTNNLKDILKSDNYKVLLQIIKTADTFNKKEREILIILLNDINDLIEKLNEEKENNNIKPHIRKKVINN